MSKKPEALVFADDRPSSTSDDLYQWAVDAENLIRAQHALIEELEDTLQFVERWAVHHGSKSSISAQEALSCIQHYPAIHEITKSYKDGKRPDTFNPYARIAELESQLEAIGASVEPLRKQAAPQAVEAAVPDAPIGQTGKYKSGDRIVCTNAVNAKFITEGREYVAGIMGRNPGGVFVVADDGEESEYRADRFIAAPAHPAEGVPAQSYVADFFREKGFYPSLAQAFAAGVAHAAAMPAQSVDEIMELADEYAGAQACAVTATSTEDADTTKERNALLSAIRAALAATQPAAQGLAALTPAARDVLAERKRQIESEGWKTERDDVYDTGEMALAAACYAAHSASCAAIKAPHTAPGVFVRTRSAQDFVGEMWPWSDDWWKPSGHRRNLEKAGALILAEIERIDRAALAAQAKQGGAA